ncbi:MAG: RluA family pseudouridine synthase [Alphaproteobacteria bacterium]|nr:RluA family pseudouridine synthase [Alphaproteobacteria bacterium]
MTAVVQRKVKPEEDGLRLDRWFARHYPQLTHGRLEKLLRTGQVRVDGARVKAGHRIALGQTVRVPPIPVAAPELLAAKPKPKFSAKDRAFVESLVLYRDADVIVLNKPSGLAVQGGTKTERHLDGLLPALAEEGKDRPRLVHRLDRDTSGVMVVAANARAAAQLAHAFRARDTRKIYWALTTGVPTPRRGKIDGALIKRAAADGRERMHIAEEGEDDDAKNAVTVFDTIDHVTTMAWVALMPLTGRTHQLRAHMAAIETPIVGDGKYGREPARTHGEVQNRLMLHARSLRIRHPNGKWLEVTAPLPPHMAKLWDLFGFDKDDKRNPFKDFEAEAPRTDYSRENRPLDRAKERLPKRGKVRSKKA